MNNNSGSNIVSVLKQKMNDTKEEITKYKEKVQDLENKIQVNYYRVSQIKSQVSYNSSNIGTIGIVLGHPVNYSNYMDLF